MKTLNERLEGFNATCAILIIIILLIIHPVCTFNNENDLFIILNPRKTIDYT